MAVNPGVLLRELQADYPVFRQADVKQAFDVACAAFQGRSLRTGESVLAHCCAVARTLADLGVDAPGVAAGLLYDVLESTMMTEAQLRKLIPGSIVDIVAKVSKMSGVCQMHRDTLEARGGRLEAQLAQRLPVMLLAMADARAVLVKLADRLQHMRGLAGGSAAAAAVAAGEALDVFAPLANRLGALHPAEHAELKARLQEGQARRRIERALDALSAALSARGLAADLSGRPKNLWGVFGKMAAKGYGLESVYDVRALRVIVSSKADCYEALRQVHTLWRPVEGRLKDYIRSPKANGYQSLHTVVLGADGAPMEVQIRTHKMHLIAEYGVAAHWRYKEAVPADVLQEQTVAYARWLVTWGMELEDKKVRPSGSPPREGLLADLAHQLCAFPSHAFDCKFATFYSAKLAPQPPPAAGAEVYVVVVDRSGEGAAGNAPLRIERCPAGCTRGQLAERLAARSPAPAHLRVLVNHEDASGAGELLAHGDQVELFESAWPASPRAERKMMDAQRARENRVPA
ncbi:hypothetical protein WJX81_004431 [Elliptochloris bilobata]|uniref:RelA/SpoT domain-containing protein n=1 Tax=Elliptochloris bilobata TaxID=381761 RepID=A0AAW1RUI6_9CHLO